MKKRRAFQIILALFATIAAMAFVTITVCVVVPLVTHVKMPILGDIVDAVTEIVGPTLLETKTLVTVEMFAIVPLMLTGISAVVLWGGHGKQWAYKFAYLFLMIGVSVPAIAACVYSKQLYTTNWLTLLLINVAVIVVYLLLPVLCWATKVDPDEEKAYKEARKAKQDAIKAINNDTAVATTTEETPEAKRNRITVKRMEILQNLLEEKKIDQQLYVALCDYVMKK